MNAIAEPTTESGHRKPVIATNAPAKITPRRGITSLREIRGRVAAEGAAGIKPELTQRICDLRDKRHPMLVQREQLEQELRAIEYGGFDPGRVRDMAERLAWILPGLG